MRFLLDTMCGGLVASLRLCNHDTAYAGDRDLEADDDLLAVARAEERTLVTRDVELANRTEDSILLTELEVEEQLAELSDAGVELELATEPAFCGRCNGRLERVESAESIPDYVPDAVAEGDGRDRTAEVASADRSAGAAADTNGEMDADANADADSPLWRCQSCGQYFWRGSHWDRVRETLAER